MPSELNESKDSHKSWVEGALDLEVAEDCLDEAVEADGS